MQKSAAPKQGIQECNLHTMNLAYLVFQEWKQKKITRFNLFSALFIVSSSPSTLVRGIDSGWTDDWP